MKKVKEQHIPRKYKEVLLHIAKNGAKTKYKIEKATRISHASVFDAIKFFEQKGIVEGEQIGQTRVGLPLKKFKLTFFGVCIALKYANPDSNDYGKIIQNWKHLSPFLFGKFDYLIKKVGIREAQWFFYRYLRDITEPITPEQIFSKCVIETILWYQQEFINEQVSQSWNANFEKWIQVFKENDDFRNVVMEFISDNFRFIDKELTWFNFLKEKLDKS